MKELIVPQAIKLKEDITAADIISEYIEKGFEQINVCSTSDYNEIMNEKLVYSKDDNIIIEYVSWLIGFSIMVDLNAKKLYIQ